METPNYEGQNWTNSPTGGNGSPDGNDSGNDDDGIESPPLIWEDLSGDDDIDEITIGDNITPCLGNIIDKLAEKDTHYSVTPDIFSSEGTTHIAQKILDIFNNSDKFGLTIDLKQLGTDSNGNEINGQTTVGVNGWDINIDKDLANNGTQLFIAKTLIHESVHAFILYNLQTNRTSEMTTDLNTLYQKFKNEDSSFNLTQHEFMSQYVDAFALSLAAADNHSLSPEYYKMLSWGGLESSNAYQALNNKSEIQNAIQNERYDRSNAKGVPCP